jgi:hypothetical protein
MLLALTCALCAIQPLTPTPAWNLPEPRLSLQEAAPTVPAQPLRLAAPLSTPAPLPLASLPMRDSGSGDGDHSDHMSPMWIVMGAVMVVMMVGVGAYAMNHRNTAARPSSTTTLVSPAMLAIPVVARSGG